MKKIFVTLSLICFVSFVSNAQTTPSATAKASVSKEAKAEPAKAEASSKRMGCCKKMSAADCAGKSMKDCGVKMSEAKADSKDHKASANAKGGSN